ncbi:heavy metal-associated isoprenylated plant protein 39 [Artemisia annua]|uniref:Heavy metal-associated isoprenylated plant protein 39 n=1 Tax=Artemisia annua TaxID=35608 RepID=A0A2U1NT40_ARTAN|nr:heavy metal-associated isoprenylated plant protein 39 [Artemisia annua]
MYAGFKHTLVVVVQILYAEHSSRNMNKFLRDVSEIMEPTSSLLTELTEYSSDTAQSKKIVLKVELSDGREKRKVMKAVSSIKGVDSIAVDMIDRKLTVTGDVDPVTVLSRLRKLVHTVIISVGPAKEPQKEDKRKSLSVDKNISNVSADLNLPDKNISDVPADLNITTRLTDGGYNSERIFFSQNHRWLLDHYQ